MKTSDHDDHNDSDSFSELARSLLLSATPLKQDCSLARLSVAEAVSVASSALPSTSSATTKEVTEKRMSSQSGQAERGGGRQEEKGEEKEKEEVEERQEKKKAKKEKEKEKGEVMAFVKPPDEFTLERVFLQLLREEMNETSLASSLGSCSQEGRGKGDATTAVAATTTRKWQTWRKLRQSKALGFDVHVDEGEERDAVRMMVGAVAIQSSDCIRVLLFAFYLYLLSFRDHLFVNPLNL